MDGLKQLHYYAHTWKLTHPATHSKAQAYYQPSFSRNCFSMHIVLFYTFYRFHVIFTHYVHFYIELCAILFLISWNIFITPWEVIFNVFLLYEIYFFPWLSWNLNHHFPCVSQQWWMSSLPLTFGLGGRALFPCFSLQCPVLLIHLSLTP